MLKTLNSLLLIAATSIAFIVPLTAKTVKAASVTLSYNGNLDGNSRIANEFTTGSPNGDAIVYQDFTVPNTENWVVDTLFSNNLMTFISPNLQARWEIRTGVSAGNGGNLIAGAASAAATQVATGRSAFGDLEYTIQVSGLKTTLTPGTYWLGIAPIGSGTGRSFMGTTSGAGAVGRPPSSIGNSFFTNPTNGVNFQPVKDVLGDPNQTNFSIGVQGTTTPPTPVPFEFSPTWGILIWGSWTAINKLKASKQK